VPMAEAGWRFSDAGRRNLSSGHIATLRTCGTRMNCVRQGEERSLRRGQLHYVVTKEAHGYAEHSSSIVRVRSPAKTNRPANSVRRSQS
jgi:hypothetical protein